MDDAEFWAVIGSTRRWERGHLAHLTRSITALGPERVVEFWHEAVTRAMQVVKEHDPTIMTLGWNPVLFALDHVLEGREVYEVLLVQGPPEALPGPGRGYEVEGKIAEFYEREVGEPFPYPDATAPNRIWAQQYYSSKGLPADLDAGIGAGFEAVNASPEIVAALDAAGLRNLEMTGTLSHDATRGWLIGPREGSWIRVRKRRWDVGVTFQWDTAALRDMTYADGLRLVCDLVDTLAAKRPGFPTSSQVAALNALVGAAPRHQAIPGLVGTPESSRGDR